MEVAHAHEQGLREKEVELREGGSIGVLPGGGTAPVQGLEVLQQLQPQLQQPPQERDEESAEVEAVSSQAAAQVLLLTEQLHAANAQQVTVRAELASQLAARDVDHAQALEMALAIQAATLAGDPPCPSLYINLTPS